MAEKKILVTQVRSSNRHLPAQKATLQCLGLGRIGRTVEHKLNASIHGMLKAVSHLVTVKEVGRS